MTEAHSPYPISPPPMQNGWLDRNARWKIPIGCLMILVLLIGFVAVILSIVTTAFRKSDVFREAIARAEQNSEVMERVGTPLSPGWLPQGQINVSGSSGSAHMAIPITGPRGKATIQLDARKTGGKWRFRTIEVEIDGKPGIVNLMQPADVVGPE